VNTIASLGASRLVCAGCGASPAATEPYPFRCPNAKRDPGVDHVLRRELDLARVSFPVANIQPNPFLRYRTLLHSYHVALAAGLSDDEFCSLVRRLDDRVAAVDGHGFVATPFKRTDELSTKLGFSTRGGVWVKDETNNVSGSHKARHLFGVLVYLEVLEQIGVVSPDERPDLAIASCGNAALAAAVVAAAGGRRLRVFVPTDAEPAVLERLESLGAVVEPCPRVEGEAGDPTVTRLLSAVEAGALPFTCQGNLNGLAVEGGQTLSWEMVSADEPPTDRIIVQVGGGALASACCHGFREACALRAYERRPRLDTVQTESAWPLKLAFDAVVADGGTSALGYAALHRSEFMRPWPSTPHSIAHGILDDETYDWLAVVEGMLETNGALVVVGEHFLARANELARDTTGIDVDPTGSAGLAGLLALRDAGRVGEDQRVALLFTGVERSHTNDAERKQRDEKLSWSRHPVAQGL